MTLLTDVDAARIMAEVKANLAVLRGCKKHSFVIPYTVTPGLKLTCLCCGGTLRLIDAMRYAEGYKAAGGNADEVLLGFNALEEARKEAEL